MMNMGSQVKENSTAVAKIWIGSIDSKLTIQNLRLDDVGIYTCSFTGSDSQSIQLNVVTGMFHVYEYKI